MTNEATTPSGQPLGISHKPSKSVAMFTKFKAENKPAFIGYLPYGSPTRTSRLTPSKTMVEHGVDAVEDRLPYSGPGHGRPGHPGCRLHRPEQRRDHQARVEAVETVANAGGVPLIMSYWNLIAPLRRRAFRPRLENAGGAGLITPSLIPDEAGRGSASDRHDLDRIFRVSPTAPPSASKPWLRNARLQGMRPPLHGRHRRTRHHRRFA